MLSLSPLRPDEPCEETHRESTTSAVTSRSGLALLNLGGGAGNGTCRVFGPTSRIAQAAVNVFPRCSPFDRHGDFLAEHKLIRPNHNIYQMAATAAWYPFQKSRGCARCSRKGEVAARCS